MKVRRESKVRCPYHAERLGDNGRVEIPLGGSAMGGRSLGALLAALLTGAGLLGAEPLPVGAVARLTTLRHDGWTNPWRTRHAVVAGHPQAVTHLAFSRGGAILTTTSEDGMVVVWDMATGVPLHSFRHKPTIDFDCRCFAADGSRLLARRFPDVLCIWNLADGACQQCTPPVTRSWELRDASASGKSVVLRTLDGFLLWDVGAAKVRQRFEPLPYPTSAPIYPSQASLSPDEANLLTIEHDIAVWDVASGKKLWELSRGALAQVAWTPDGTHVRCLVGPEGAGAPSLPLFLEAATGKPTTLSTLRDAGAYGIAAPDGAVHATINEHGAVTLWEAATGIQLATFATPRGEPVRGATFQPLGQRDGLAFDHAGRRLAVGIHDTSVLVYDLAALALAGAGRLDEEQLWTVLASNQGPPLFRALAQAAAMGDDAVALFRKRMTRPSPAAGEQLPERRRLRAPHGRDERAGAARRSGGSRLAASGGPASLPRSQTPRRDAVARHQQAASSIPERASASGTGGANPRTDRHAAGAAPARSAGARRRTRGGAGPRRPASPGKTFVIFLDARRRCEYLQPGQL
jgi:hypothetical protein